MHCNLIKKDKMQTTKFSILFTLLLLFETSCSTTKSVQSNEKYFEENINSFKRITEEEVRNITNNATIRHYDKDYHGNQIEYNSSNGKTYLWYPLNKKLVAGYYKVKDNRVICFNYIGKVKNELTKEVGGVWNCQEIATYLSGIKETRNLNVFKFNDDKTIPFVLNRFPEETISSLLDKVEN